MLAEGGDTVESRTAYGFRLCLARPPSKRELTRMVNLVQEATQRYTEAPGEAKALTGETPELAGWTVLGNVLLNLDEFFMKR